MALTAAIGRLSPLTAGLLFAGYAGLNGVTLSFLLLFYTSQSVAITFGITAATFGIMTLWGFTTHRDLSKMGSLLVMALVGFLLASLANLFLRNPAIYWITTYAFIRLIAYDTQKLKRMSMQVSQDDELEQKASIVGALTLYLDFINLFLLLLLWILGKRR